MNCFEDLKNRIPNDLIANIEKMTNGLEQSPYDQTTLDELISYLLNEAGFLSMRARFGYVERMLRINLSQSLLFIETTLTLKELSGKIGDLRIQFKMLLAMMIVSCALMRIIDTGLLAGEWKSILASIPE